MKVLAKGVLFAGKRVGVEPSLHDIVTDEEALEALEQLEALDQRLGVGTGASKERKKLNSILEQWEQQQSDDDVDENDDFDDDGSESDFVISWDAAKFVPKHLPKERVAIFGGDPARRSRSVEKKLAPFRTLDQFGTPRDVGPSDTARMLRKIASQSYDVVYIWTRFNCHASRGVIRDACLDSGTRFEEVESLAFIREVPSATS